MNPTQTTSEDHAGSKARPVTSLFGADSRIRSECLNAFPASPEFATYLAKRILALNGSILVAQLFINQFRMCFLDSTIVVLPEHVMRLGVDQNPHCVTSVFTALLTNEFPIIQALARLEINLKGDIESDDAVHYTQPEHKAVDLDQLVPLQHLFICASAMLVGITIDPRVLAA
ncbi:MAG: hypothetical protein NTX72_05605 [Candidatus Uhrbacteria bacterium]|nr:hypothetical protein [Candidatus Uhrbacteria bacterium]